MRSSWQCQCASSTPAPPAPPGELRDKLLPHSNLRGHRGLSAVCCLLSPLQLSHISHSSPARNYTLVPFTSDSSIVVIILQPGTIAGIIFDSFHIKSPSWWVQHSRRDSRHSRDWSHKNKAGGLGNTNIPKIDSHPALDNCTDISFFPLLWWNSLEKWLKGWASPVFKFLFRAEIISIKDLWVPHTTQYISLSLIQMQSLVDSILSWIKSLWDVARQSVRVQWPVAGS